MVWNLLIPKELGETKSHWMTSLQDYDLEIKFSKIVRGQGLSKLVTENMDAKKKREEGWENEDFMHEK